jgi:hypothetical protein
VREVDSEGELPPKFFRCGAVNVLAAALATPIVDAGFFEERIRTVANVDVSGTSEGPWNSEGVGIENSDGEAVAGDSVGGVVVVKNEVVSSAS